MYGLGLVEVGRGVFAPVGTFTSDDSINQVVGDSVGSSTGGYAVRQFNQFDPVRQFAPRSIGASVSDAPVPAPTPMPAPAPAPVPVAAAVVPVAWEGSPSAGVPWWVWALGLGGAFFAFKGAK